MYEKRWSVSAGAGVNPTWSASNQHQGVEELLKEKARARYLDANLGGCRRPAAGPSGSPATSSQPKPRRNCFWPSSPPLGDHFR